MVTSVGFSNTHQPKENTVVFYTGGSYNPPHPMHVEAFLARVREELNLNPGLYAGKEILLYMFPVHDSYVKNKCAGQARPAFPSQARIELLDQLLQNSLKKNPLPANVIAQVDDSECEAKHFIDHDQVFDYLKNKFASVNYCPGQDLYDAHCKHHCSAKMGKDHVFPMLREGYQNKQNDDSLSSSKIIGLKGKQLEPALVEKLEKDYGYISLLTQVTTKHQAKIPDFAAFQKVLTSYQKQLKSPLVGGTGFSSATANLPKEDTPEELQQLAAFKKIYIALREGQSSWFKTNWLSTLDKLSASEAIKLIKEHSNKEGSRTQKAWELVGKHSDYSNKNTDLVRDIYQYSFEQSGWFKCSQVTGQTFFSSTSLNQVLSTDLTKDRIGAAKKNTRTDKILRSLTP